MVAIFIKLLIPIFISWANAQTFTTAQVCSTVSGPDPGKKCVLPFKHDGNLYTACPIDPDDNSKFWCSTKTDANGNHIPGINAFGHCGPNCPLVTQTNANLVQSRSFEPLPASCITVSGPGAGKPCVFPFKYRGQTYTGCDTDPDDPSKLWCSTKVDELGNHVTGQNEYGHCGNSCPRQQGSGNCKTVSGPNPGKNCIFPFKHDGKTYFGCPIDPDDSSKRWCSTRVDQNGNHVVGQNEYGHCASTCPQHFESIQDNSIVTTATTANCPGSQKCKSFTACAAQVSLNSGTICSQSDGSNGLCCKEIIRNSGNSILSRQSSGSDISFVPQRQVSDAVDFGQNFASNVTATTRQFRGNFGKGSAEFVHTQFLKPRQEVQGLSVVALTSAFAAKQLQLNEANQDNSISFRQSGFANADTTGSLLSQKCPAEPLCDFNSKYRTIDGSCNNIGRPKYGQLLTPMQRILPNAYADGIISPRRASNGRVLPSARVVTSTVLSVGHQSSFVNTALLMALGQFIDHDLTHVPMKMDNGKPIDCCQDGKNNFDPSQGSSQDAICFPIRIPRNDAFFKQKRDCMNFARSEGAMDLDCQPGPLQQINQITHWLDSSNVYGSTESETRKLRAFSGGLLRTQLASDGGELLPQDNEKECIGGPSNRCFLAGDARVNEQPTLAVMHTLFLREHNRVCRQLARFNPHWDDEILFQEARRIVNAQWQHIVYNEWLPIVLGEQYMSTFGLLPLTMGFSSSYRTDFDPRITNAFATAAFRIGHTLIPGLIRSYSARGFQTRSIELKKAFGNMDILLQRNMIEELLRGLVTDPVESVDNNFVDDIVNHLFNEEQADGLGLDLVALNIQRGRDHGLPGYVEYRKICQVGRADSFDDLASNIAIKKIELLRRAYKTVEDIDLYIGMILEEPAPGALVGKTFLCLIGDQFARLKLGDRYFYDLANQSGSFSLGQLNEIRKTSLARIICDNSLGITEVQPLALQMPNNQRNPTTSCSSGLLFMGIPSIDFSLWKQ